MPPNPKVVFVRFINITSGKTYNCYPEEEKGLWINSHEKGYFIYRVKNMGDAGNCYISFGGGGYAEVWGGNMNAGEEKDFTTTTFDALSRDGPAWGQSTFWVVCKDATVTPYRDTDAVGVYVLSFCGFRVTAYDGTTRVTASGTINGQSYTTTPTQEPWIHVGRYLDVRNTLFTITCTYGKQTLQTQAYPGMSPVPVVEFHFGVYVPPNLVFERLALVDSVLGEFEIYPAGQTPYITFGGTRYYKFRIKNIGGSTALGVWVGGDSGVLNGTLDAGQVWESRTITTYNGEQKSFTTYESCGYDPGGNPVETDRIQFVINQQVTETFPSPADLWCESLQSPDGVGAWVQYEGQLSLDTTVKTVGNASIKYVIPKGFSHLVWNMINGKIDANKYPLMLHYIKCLNPQYIGQIYTIRLVDGTGKKALIDTVLKTADWALKPLLVGDANQYIWMIEAGFNWSNIKQVEFDFQASQSTIIWIDAMYFRIAPAIPRTVFINVVDKSTGQPLPNITCRLGDYIDSVKFVYGGYMDNTDANGNAVIENIPYEPGGTATYYVFAEDPQGKYVQLPEDDVVVHLESGDQSISIKMAVSEGKPPDFLPLILVAGIISFAVILASID